MRETADIVIVGAGFAGAATAFHLARRQAGRIVLLERERIPGQHASGKNAALAFTALDDPAEARLACEGLQFLHHPPEGFCDEALIHPSGSLLVSNESESEGKFLSACAAARALGLETEVVSGDDIGTLVPPLRPHLPRFGLLNRSDGVVDIHALLQGYLGGARRAGAQILFDEAVREVVCERGRVRAVRTQRHEFATSCLVNAAGAWAGEIARLAGAEVFRIEPRRRHLFLAHLDEPVEPGLPFVWHSDVDVYFRPEGHGLLFSPCDATPHPPAEPATDEAAKALLAEKIARAFPSLIGARIVTGWACLRTFSPDERFVIGPDPFVSGLFWVACLGGHGMTTSAAVGRLAADAITGQHNPLLESFTPARFLTRRAP